MHDQIQNHVVFNFNPPLPLALTFEKRLRGRPKKEQPALPLGHHRYVLSDLELDTVEFSSLEKTRFINEFKYETQVLFRSDLESLSELCPLYNIPYKVGYELISHRV